MKSRLEKFVILSGEDLKEIKSKKVLLKKFNFVLSHCGLRSPKIVYRRGVFIGELFELVGKSIKRRKIETPACLADLMLEYRTYKGI